MDARSQQIKAIILDQSKSVREFCKENDLVYTTIDTMLKRDIGRSAFDTVAKVCNILGLCVESLAQGEVRFQQERSETIGKDEMGLLCLYGSATDEGRLVAQNVLRSNQRELDSSKKGA